MIQLTSQDKAKIAEFIRAGIDAQEIADAFGLPLEYMQDEIKKAKQLETLATKFGVPEASRDALVVEAYVPPQKMAIVDIERMLGVSPATIYRILRRAKVQLRRSYDKTVDVPILKYVDELEQLVTQLGGESQLPEARKRSGWG